jgi:predicted PurR-regulated permease PerM
MASRKHDQPDVRFRKLFVAIVVVLLTILFLRVIGPFLQPLFLAAVLTGILYPFYTWLRRYLTRDTLAAGVTVILVLVAVVLPLLLLIGVFTREAVRLTEVIGPWVEQTTGDAADLRRRLPGWLPFADQLAPFRTQIYERFGDGISQAGTFAINGLSRIGQGTFTFFLNLLVMLYALFFFLLAGPRLLTVFDYTPLTKADRDRIVSKGISITRATLKGTIVVGVLQGTLGGVGFAVVGIPAPVFWGAVMAVASVVPVIGTALVWVPAVLYLLIQGESVAGLGLAAWCAIAVSGSDNIVRPHLIGNDTRMPDVLVLLSTLGGIAMFGATGIVIGPVVAGLFITSWHIFATTFERELEPFETAETPPERDVDAHDAAA